MLDGTWNIAPLYKGALIRSEYPLYYHVGIYMGEDKVIEFGNPITSKGKSINNEVEIVDIETFAGPGVVEVYKYTRKELKQKNSDEQIIEIALSHLGEKGYDFLKNNCEHFATLCVFNKAFSPQVAKVYDEVGEKLKGEK